MFILCPKWRKNSRFCVSGPGTFVIMNLPCGFALEINPFTPDSTTFKADKFSKITNWVKLKNKHHHIKVQLSNELSHLRVLSIESKRRELCITQGFTVGVKGLRMDTSGLWLGVIPHLQILRLGGRTKVPSMHVKNSEK